MHAAGFLSIDCGLEANYSGYTDTIHGIFYVSDGSYVDAGENHGVAADKESGRIRPDLTVRSFPSGVRNCYALPTNAGNKYLVRVVAFYGNYDGKNSSSSLQFDLHLGSNYWDTVQAGSTKQVYEALFVAWASWAPVCLINTGQGTPFVSSVELRMLGSELYPHVMTNQSMRLHFRDILGPTTVSRSVARYVYLCRRPFSLESIFLRGCLLYVFSSHLNNIDHCIIYHFINNHFKI